MLTTTDDAAIRAAIVRYLANEGVDRDASHEVYHEDAILEFPQSGEQFVGRATIREWRERYPSKTRFRLRRIVGSGSTWTAEILISYDGGPWMFGIGIYESGLGRRPADRMARDCVQLTTDDCRFGAPTGADAAARLGPDGRTAQVNAEQAQFVAWSPDSRSARPATSSPTEPDVAAPRASIVRLAASPTGTRSAQCEPAISRQDVADAHAPAAMTFRGKPQVGPGTSTPLTVVPANEASWEDLRAIFGDRGYAGVLPVPEVQDAQLGGVADAPGRGPDGAPPADTHCGFPSASSTTGLVAYLDGEPVGWCAVEPRSAYPRLRRTPFRGRTAPKIPKTRASGR